MTFALQLFINLHVHKMHNTLGGGGGTVDKTLVSQP